MPYGSNDTLFRNTESRINAILAFKSGEDLSNSVGVGVKVLPSGDVAKTTGAIDEQPFGVILKGAKVSSENSVAIMCNGFAGTALCAVTKGADVGDLLCISNENDPGLFGSTDTLSGSTDTTTVCAVALEKAPVTNPGTYARIEAAIFHPIRITLNNIIYNNTRITYNGIQLTYNSN